MEHKKTKIVLDADVIIHFMEANYFSISVSYTHLTLPTKA